MGASQIDKPRPLRWDLWFCAAGLIGGTLALTDIVWNEAPAGMRGERPHDFAHYYVAAGRVLYGKNPYVPVTDEVEQLLGFRHYEAPVADTPAMLTLQAPLGWFPYRMSWLVFAAGSVLVAVGSNVAVCRVLKLSWPIAVGVAGAALMSRPFRQCLYYNHAEWLVLGVSALGWYLARSGQSAGGLLWGLAAALKLFPGMLLISSLLGRQWRVALWTFIGGCVFTLLGTIVIGWQPTWEFITVTVPRSKIYYTWTGNSSLMTIGTVLSGQTWGGAALTIVGLMSIVIALWRRPGGIDRAYVAGTAAALILSPLSWIYYGILAFPPLIILGARCDWHSPQQRATYIALAAILLFWPLAVIENLPLSLATFLALTVPRLSAYGVLFAWSLRAVD
jgi:hypothetical protein